MPAWKKGQREASSTALRGALGRLQFTPKIELGLHEGKSRKARKKKVSGGKSAVHDLLNAKEKNPWGKREGVSAARCESSAGGKGRGGEGKNNTGGNMVKGKVIRELKHVSGTKAGRVE